MDYVLHPENFDRIPLTGKHIRAVLNQRAMIVAAETAALVDPNVSVVIRSKNDAAYIKELFDDLGAQDFNGKLEIIIVDTESTDETVAIATAHGAKIISIRQADFTYPKALNVGYQAAKYPFVLNLVGHSSLSNRQVLKGLTRWCYEPHFGGIYNFPLPNWNASKIEAYATGLGVRYYKDPDIVRRSSPGMLGANCSIISRKAWEDLGGFDERYAGGGEDTALGREMLKRGMLIVRDPICTVFHSHGLGPINSLRQLLHWQTVGKDRPQDFNSDELLKRRPDLVRKN